MQRRRKSFSFSRANFLSSCRLPYRTIISLQYHIVFVLTWWDTSVGVSCCWRRYSMKYVDFLTSRHNCGGINAVEVINKCGVHATHFASFTRRMIASDKGYRATTVLDSLMLVVSTTLLATLRSRDNKSNFCGIKSRRYQNWRRPYQYLFDRKCNMLFAKAIHSNKETCDSNCRVEC